MFKCDQCTLEFTVKRILIAHRKTHEGVRLPCIRCGITFSYKTNLNKHLKNAHGMYFCVHFKYLLYYNFLSGIVQIAPHIFVPNLQPRTSYVRKDRASSARDKQNVRLSPVRDNMMNEITSNVNEC